MNEADDLGTAMAVLRLATQVVDGIQAGLALRGFDDVRPHHGFAFVRISDGDASVIDVADYLGVTKQAAGQLVSYLEQKEYVTRRPHPDDGRAHLLGLTARGRACTRAAEEAAAETVHGWQAALDPDDLTCLRRSIVRLVTPGRLRPAW